MTATARTSIYSDTTPPRVLRCYHSSADAWTVRGAGYYEEDFNAMQVHHDNSTYQTSYPPLEYCGSYMSRSQAVPSSLAYRQRLFLNYTIGPSYCQLTSRPRRPALTFCA